MNPTLTTKNPWWRSNGFYSLAALAGALVSVWVFDWMPAEPPSLVANADFAYFFYSRGFGWVVKILDGLLQSVFTLPALLFFACLILSAYFGIRTRYNKRH